MCEVRAAAAFCALSVEGRFPGLVDFRAVSAAADLETDAGAAAWFYRAVASQGCVGALLGTYINRFDCFRTDYVVGAAVFDCFAALPVGR